MRRTVVIVAKAPVPGQAKTRLAASIGSDAAAALAAAFIADLTSLVARLEARPVLAWAGDREHPAFDEARRLGFEFVAQADGDLGARLDGILHAEGARSESVVVIGSDSPTLTPQHFEDAWRSLETHDVVLGPSFDGGYYLVGAKTTWFAQTRGAGPHPIFTGVDWSTSRVLAQTLRRGRAIGALCDLIRFCYDVDTQEDLEFLTTHLLEHLRPSGLDVAQKTAILLSNTPTTEAEVGDE